MKQFRSVVCLSLAAAALPLTGGTAAPAYAQVSMTDPDAHVLCPAFQRSGHGAWTATAPVTLDFSNGLSIRVAPGQSFVPNSTTGGVEVSAVLDRHCGNM